MMRLNSDKREQKNDTKKVVIFFTHYFPCPDKPGSSRPWVEANILKELGYKVVVITSGVDYLTGESEMGWRLFKSEKMCGIKVVKVATIPHYRISHFRRTLHYFIYSMMAFFAALFQRKPDRILLASASYFITFWFFLYKIIKARGVKFILDERDMMLESFVAFGILRRRVRFSILRQWDRFVRRRADCVITVSEGMKKHLMGQGVPQSKIEVIPNIDVELMSKDIEKDYREPRNNFYGREGFVVMYTGSFGMANDVSTILKAAEYLDKIHENIGFILLGTGEKLNYYKEYIKAKNLGNTMIMGGLSREKTRSLLYNADVCLHAFRKEKPSNAALSSKIFDYLLFKKPIIYSGEGETRDLIQESGAGVCVEAQNANELAKGIMDLCSSRQELRAMGERGERYVRSRYSKESVYEAFAKRFI
ncbi:MAG: glycosyltransferase family 4 protein [Candidatus Omnitrophota bacterium]